MVNPKLEEIKGRVMRQNLHMKDVLPETVTRFKEVSDSEFGGHYGWTLKWLLDFREGILTGPGEEVQSQLDSLEQQVIELREMIAQQPPTEQKLNGRRMVGGNVIPERGEPKK